MGHVRSEKLSNGNIALEITYGGQEAPFGGVDTSAPPAYIDPRCFTNADGFLVINNKLVATYLAPAAIPPTILSGVAGTTLLCFGTFYNSTYGQLNYILAYTPVPFGVPGDSPTGVRYTFFITSWFPDNPAEYWDDTLDITLFDGIESTAQAIGQVESIATGYSSTTAATGAVATITALADNGTATAATVTGGTGYVVGMVCLLQQVDLFGSAQIVITSIGAGGSITGFTFSPSLTVQTLGPATVVVISGAETTLVIDGPNGSNTYNVTAGSVGTGTDWGYSRRGLVASMVSQMSTDPNVSAAASPDGYAIVFTSKITGALGSAFTITDTSSSVDTASPPAFYFACRDGVHLEGGAAPMVTIPAPTILQAVSTTAVGGTVYFANLGPQILKYSGPGHFEISTQYQGMAVIRKFAGKLIGLRPIPQLGVELQNSDMVWAWTVTGQLDIWADTSAEGFVTGAGFEQIADISDFLSGLVVTSGTAFIIRSQGVSYATATGNATLPFTVNHIGLGERGEGCQISQLVCQYDQTGVYVGGTNVFQLSGSISAIGEKIKKLIFDDLEHPTNGPGKMTSSNACQVYLGGEEFTLVGLDIARQVFSSYISLATYFYNVVNGTWMPIRYVAGTQPWDMTDSVDTSLCGVFAQKHTFSDWNEYNQSLFTFGFQRKLSDGSLASPTFWSLTDGVSENNSPNNQNRVVFPVEEALFGRDVTIDSLYIALNGAFSTNLFIQFFINDQYYAALILPLFNNLNSAPREFQIFPDASYGVGAFTAKSPQLMMVVNTVNPGEVAQLRITKLMMMASFDPSQRPT